MHASARVPAATFSRVRKGCVRRCSSPHARALSSYARGRSGSTRSCNSEDARARSSSPVLP
eukprot:6023830-Pleurochrysis_carterae.AAC.5